MKAVIPITISTAPFVTKSWGGVKMPPRNYSRVRKPKQSGSIHAEAPICSECGQPMKNTHSPKPHNPLYACVECEMCGEYIGENWHTFPMRGLIPQLKPFLRAWVAKQPKYITRW